MDIRDEASATRGYRCLLVVDCLWRLVISDRASVLSISIDCVRSNGSPRMVRHRPSMCHIPTLLTGAWPIAFILAL